MPYDAKTTRVYTPTPTIVDCDACGNEYPIERTQAIETYHATEETPAEYATICNACAEPSAPYAATRQRYAASYWGHPTAADYDR